MKHNASFLLKRTYGPWWLMLPSNINLDVPNKPLYISTDFIGIQNFDGFLFNRLNKLQFKMMI